MRLLAICALLCLLSLVTSQLTYTVRPGDTMHKIFHAHYGSGLNFGDRGMLKELPDYYVPGETIKMPNITYTTKAGDNLEMVAKKMYGDEDRWKEVYEDNERLVDKSRYAKIKIGTVLTIQPSYPSSEYVTHTDDTLKLIAQLHYRDHTKWRLIYEANKFEMNELNYEEDPQKGLPFGEVLVIPPLDYIVQKGDSISSISNKFYGGDDNRGTEGEIWKANRRVLGSTTNSFLPPGKVIKIPPIKQPLPITYKGQKGDNWKKISKKFYGRELFWEEISDFNFDMVGRLKPGKDLEGYDLVIPIPRYRANGRMSLKDIAGNVYEFSEYWTKIYEANEEMLKKLYWIIPEYSSLKNGESLIIPPLNYVVQEGDTFPLIAEKVYGDSRKSWKLYYENQEKIGKFGQNMRPGQVISLLESKNKSVGGNEERPLVSLKKRRSQSQMVLKVPY